MARKVIKTKRANGKRTRQTTKQPNARSGLPKKPGAKRQQPKRKGVVTPSPRSKRPAPRDVGPIDLMQEAFSEITTLAEEMRSWADGMEEKFSSTSKFETVSASADTLEGIDEPDVTVTALNDHKLQWQDPTPRRRGFSRSARAANAVDMLRTVEDKLRDLVEELPEDDPQHDAADALADEVQTAADELEGVEFPGMFG